MKLVWESSFTVRELQCPRYDAHQSLHYSLRRRRVQLKHSFNHNANSNPNSQIGLESASEGDWYSLIVITVIMQNLSVSCAELCPPDWVCDLGGQPSMSCLGLQFLS